MTIRRTNQEPTTQPAGMTANLPRASDVEETAGHYLAYAGVWFAVVAWGASFVAARMLLHASAAGEASLSPVVLAALRFGVASLFFIVPLLNAMARRQLQRSDLLKLAVLGQITFSLYFWLQYTGVQETSAGIASILVVGLIPLVTSCVSQLIGQEELSPARVGALILGFAGVAIIVLQKPLGVALHSGFVLGALCLVGNAFAFAAYGTLSKRWMRSISPILMTGGTMVSGTIGLLLLSLTDPAGNRWNDVARLAPAQWMALLYLAVVCSVMAYFVYNFALTKIDASRAAVYIYFEPVIAVLLGMAMLGEQLTWQTAVGAATIASSVAIVTLVKR